MTEDQIIALLGTGSKRDSIQQIYAVLSGHPTYTADDFSALTSKTVSWLVEILSMAKRLHVNVLVKVVAGEICFMNGIALTRLSPRDQLKQKKDWHMDPREFVPIVNRLAKLAKEKARYGSV